MAVSGTLDDVLAVVPQLGGDAARVQDLPGGLTNVNYLVTSPAGESFVVRRWSATGALLAIDRENEHHNSRAAAEAGVGAEVVAFLPEQTCLVLRFLEGSVLSAEALQAADEGLLVRVAAACRKLHGGPPFRDRFDMFSLQRRYLSLVRERGFRLPPRYLEHEPRVREIERAMSARPEPLVPCHNDLLAENLIDGGGVIRFIDYEYSGTNEASFEVGNIWSESDLSLDQLESLTSAYWQRPLRHKVARARLWGLMSKYGWMLWASIQDGVSEIDFDFWSWGLEKYDRAEAELASPDLPRLLRDVQRDD
jgi:thiamine kinase-like enzyme